MKWSEHWFKNKGFAFRNFKSTNLQKKRLLSIKQLIWSACFHVFYLSVYVVLVGVHYRQNNNIVFGAQITRNPHDNEAFMKTCTWQLLFHGVSPDWCPHSFMRTIWTELQHVFTRERSWPPFHAIRWLFENFSVVGTKCIVLRVHYYRQQQK